MPPIWTRVGLLAYTLGRYTAKLGPTSIAFRSIRVSRKGTFSGYFCKGGYQSAMIKGTVPETDLSLHGNLKTITKIAVGDQARDSVQQ